jgi:IS1 family transposase
MWVYLAPINTLHTDKRAAVIAALVEGNSIRATCRMTGAAKNTVVKLLMDVGIACAAYQDKVMHDLPCTKIQCDEIWSFVYAKDKNASYEMKRAGKAGDVWTWTAICADTKLVPCWFIGTRDAGAAYHFMHDLADRLRNRVQLTTDGHKAYLNAVEDAFGGNIDYAMLIKIYGNCPDKGDTRYSPGMCMGSRVARITGNPEYHHISTSYAERQNLTMRMNMRRFTRLTNGFSKKVENHAAAIALHFMHYNFCRIHQTLRVTPAMEVKLTDHVWSIEEVLALLKNKSN